ncbi:uncharacterized protein [Euwallacea fornicatus]|uniref:uncharacterized protein isoform X2 n=1 Tax=Euwallacea fornicatus TaxID=995702 RepID=UPI00338E5A18
MKIVILLLSVLFGVSLCDLTADDVTVKGIIDDIINATINDIVSTLDDPLTLNASSNTFNDAILTGWLKTSDFVLKGLKSIVANYIDVSYNTNGTSSINLTVTLESLNLFSNYETSLLIGQLFPFSGKGNISANLDSFSVKLYTLANVTFLSNVSIGNFKNTTIDILIGEDTWIDVEGAWNSDEASKLINEYLATLVPKIVEYIDVNHVKISQVLSPILQELLENLFGGEFVSAKNLDNTQIELGVFHDLINN